MQIGHLGKEREARFQFCAEESAKAETQSARRARPRCGRRREMKFLLRDGGQRAEAALGEFKIRLLQSFLWTIHARTARWAEQRVIYVHRHGEFLKPAL